MLHHSLGELQYLPLGEGFFSIIQNLVEGLVPMNQRLPEMAPELLGVLERLSVCVLIAHFQVICNDRNTSPLNSEYIDPRGDPREGNGAEAGAILDTSLRSKWNLKVPLGDTLTLVGHIG